MASEYSFAPSEYSVVAFESSFVAFEYSVIASESSDMAFEYSNAPYESSFTALANAFGAAAFAGEAGETWRQQSCFGLARRGSGGRGQYCMMGSTRLRRVVYGVAPQTGFPFFPNQTVA